MNEKVEISDDILLTQAYKLTIIAAFLHISKPAYTVNKIDFATIPRVYAMPYVLHSRYIAVYVIFACTSVVKHLYLRVCISELPCNNETNLLQGEINIFQLNRFLFNNL